MKCIQKAQELGLSALHSATSSRASLSDQDIFALQEYFLKPGLQYLTIPDTIHYTMLVDTFMRTFFSSIAVISSDTTTSRYFNLYQDLINKEVLTHDDGSLEEYMLTAFCCDALIVEGTRDILQSRWYNHFEQLLIDYDYIKKIPVFVFVR